MTDTQDRTPRPSRPSTLQDDLLDDLRRTTPAAAPPPSGPRAGATGTPAPPAPEEESTVPRQITPTRWLAVSLQQAAGRRRVLLTAGPLSVSIDLTRD